MVLEDQMIKKHKPKYNVLLKDDKSYPYIKITTNELFPRIYLTREKQQKNILYFGPYISAKDARVTIDTLREFFPIRTSKMALDGKKIYKPCVNYQMGKCLAPCNGEVKPIFYQKMITEIIHILKGNADNLLQNLQEQMKKKSRLLEYEESAKIRDKIFSINKTIKKKTIISTKKINKDVIAILKEKSYAGIEVFFIRSGVLFGSDFFFYFGCLSL